MIASLRLTVYLGGGALALFAADILAARTSLGIFGDWGAFSDARQGRCYAIATALPDPRQRERQPFMTVGTWPRSGVHGQLYWRLSRVPAATSPISVRVGGQSHRLQARGADAWAQGAAVDAAIKAAMRSAQTLNVYYRDTRGRRFSDKYRLQGAATALDAATLACAQRR